MQLYIRYAEAVLLLVTRQLLKLDAPSRGDGRNATYTEPLDETYED